MSPTILALVLARGGSKGIPHKNIKFLNGKPLLAYTIIEAKQSKYIDRVVLSTDDPEIAGVGRAYGAEAPFLRPAELATDSTSSIDTMIHALEWLASHANYRPDFTMLLQPTSPLRKMSDIDGAVESLLNANGDSLVSLSEADQHPYWMKRVEDNRVVPFAEEGKQILRRQDLPKVYNLNGAIYIARTEMLVEQRTFYVGTTIPYIMPKERSVDIDDMVDWIVAETLMKERG